jgi:hypothetical protein
MGGSIREAIRELEGEMEGQRRDKAAVAAGKILGSQ